MEKYNITISKEELKNIVETDDSFQEFMNNIYDKLLLLEAKKILEKMLEKLKCEGIEID